MFVEDYGLIICLYIERTRKFQRLEEPIPLVDAVRLYYHSKEITSAVKMYGNVYNITIMKEGSQYNYRETVNHYLYIDNAEDIRFEIFRAFIKALTLHNSNPYVLKELSEFWSKLEIPKGLK